MKTSAFRINPPRWLGAIVLGALVGAIVLGLGGRLAMRGITLWENRARQSTIGGTVRIMGFGALFGVLGGLVRAAVDKLAARFLPQRSPGFRTSAFAVVCMALALIVLTPLTVHRLVLFPPVAALYIGVFENLWRRSYLPYEAYNAP